MNRSSPSAAAASGVWKAVYELVDGVTAVESGYCNGHV